MEGPEIPIESLTFNRFKDWVFLGVLTLLVSLLIESIYDLNRSVRELSKEMAIGMSSIKSLETRVEILERQ